MTLTLCSLRYRMSIPGVATKPEAHEWKTSLFSPTHNQLPGYTRTGQLGVEKLFLETTYPRFIRIDDDLLLSYRIGMYVNRNCVQRQA